MRFFQADGGEAGVVDVTGNLSRHHVDRQITLPRAWHRTRVVVTAPGSRLFWISGCGGRAYDLTQREA